MAQRPYNFVVFGGLTKPYYERFRELRKKYDLNDRELIECMISLTLEFNDPANWDGPHYAGRVLDFATLIGEYKDTAPVDQPPLPEVQA